MIFSGLTKRCSPLTKIFSAAEIVACKATKPFRKYGILCLQGQKTEAQDIIFGGRIMNRKNQKNTATELVFILDRSGSMSGLEGDTIGGFNAMLEKQKKQPGDCFVTTVLFDHELVTLHDRLPLARVPLMTQKDYTVRGCTALLDAVGSTIRHIVHIHRYARAEDVPAHTLFVITTDGMENASRKYSLEQVRQMIEKERDKYGWEFLFLGANMDAVQTAGAFGIHADRAVTYQSDSVGTQLNYEVLSDTIECIRMDAPLSADWKSRIEEDTDKRGK